MTATAGAHGILAFRPENSSMFCVSLVLVSGQTLTSPQGSCCGLSWLLTLNLLQPSFGPSPRDFSLPSKPILSSTSFVSGTAWNFEQFGPFPVQGPQSL